MNIEHKELPITKSSAADCAQLVASVICRVLEKVDDADKREEQLIDAVYLLNFLCARLRDEELPTHANLNTMPPL